MLRLLQSLLAAAGPGDGSASVPPEQFHIAYSARPQSMWVTWVRPNVSVADAGEPLCQYNIGRAAGSSTVRATTRSYVDNMTGCRSNKAYGGPCVPWSGVIHTALLPDLPSRAPVHYSCGTTGLMSKMRMFTSRGEPEGGVAGGGQVTFALLGDQGTSMRNINGETRQRASGGHCHSCTNVLAHRPHGFNHQRVCAPSKLLHLRQAGWSPTTTHIQGRYLSATSSSRRPTSSSSTSSATSRVRPLHIHTHTHILPTGRPHAKEALAPPVSS